MGTRSTVKFYSEFDQEEPVVSVYQQYDGYINGVGYDLAIFLKEKTIIHIFRTFILFFSIKVNKNFAILSHKHFKNFYRHSLVS